MEKFCSKCGFSLAAEAHFCGNCGEAVNPELANQDARVPALKPEPKRKLKRKTLVIAAATTLALVAGSIFAANYYADAKAKEEAAAAAARFQAKQDEVASLFAIAIKRCLIEDTGVLFGIEYAYDYLKVDGMGEEDYFGASYSDASCLVDNLDMPMSTKSRWESTRALDGQLTDSWSGPDDDWTIEAYWSYHPDSGVEMVFELSSKYLEGYKAPAKEDSSAS